MQNRYRFYKNIFGALLFLAICIGCKSEKKEVLTVEVSNPLAIDRTTETVHVKLTDKWLNKPCLIVVEKESGKVVSSQRMDIDKNGSKEELIFQVALAKKENVTYLIKDGIGQFSLDSVTTFGRFVPERTDDFTWENDKVAFRVYGPTAQRMVEEGEKGGTLSGGVDCWLKKVDYSIINKWYAGNVAKPGYYHIDHGEGLDNYHVGPSLGCGGIGVMQNGELVTSVNYTGYNVLTNGPIETRFELDYAPFGVDGKSVKHKKIGSIDLGSNFTKFVIEVEGADTLTTGLTLHDKKGQMTIDEESVWGDYWAPHFDTELGTAIVVDPKYYAGHSKVVVDKKDKSHLLLHLKAIDNKIEYYTGFAWSKSKQFANKEEWENHLANFAKQVQSPLQVTIR